MAISSSHGDAPDWHRPPAWEELDALGAGSMRPRHTSFESLQSGSDVSLPHSVFAEERDKQKLFQAMQERRRATAFSPRRRNSAGEDALCCAGGARPKCAPWR